MGGDYTAANDGYHNMQINKERQRRKEIKGGTSQIRRGIQWYIYLVVLPGQFVEF